MKTIAASAVALLLCAAPAGAFQSSSMSSQPYGPVLQGDGSALQCFGSGCGFWYTGDALLTVPPKPPAGQDCTVWIGDRTLRKEGGCHEEDGALRADAGFTLRFRKEPK